MPTTTPTHNFSARSSKRGEELLDALERIVLAEGFCHINVSDLATRLACSKRTLYELAGSRNELILRVVWRFFARIRRDAARACTQSNDPREQVYDYLQVGVRAAEHLSAVAVSDIQKWPPARECWQEHISERVAGLRVLIDAGIATGAFHEIRSAFVAEMVFASINRLRAADFYESTKLTISEGFDELYRMLLLTLAPSANAAPYARGAAKRELTGKRTQH